MASISGGGHHLRFYPGKIPGAGIRAAGGRALGTLLVAAIIFGIIYASIGKLTGASQAALFKLGLGWTVATIMFEFLFGHYVMGHAWDSLWADYNVFQGGSGPWCCSLPCLARCWPGR